MKTFVAATRLCFIAPEDVFREAICVTGVSGFRFHFCSLKSMNYKLELDGLYLPKAAVIDNFKTGVLGFKGSLGTYRPANAPNSFTYLPAFISLSLFLVAATA